MGSASSASRGAHLVVVDAANCIYRAFFALPPLRNIEGVPTHAAYGFVNMLNKVIRDENPDHFVVVFDAPGKSFRHEMFPDYKATRDAQPEDLSRQFPLCRELVDAYRMQTLQVEGVEADDVIATLVAEAPEDLRITILSTDKDLMQLVSDRVSLLDTMKSRRYGPDEVQDRFGVPPARVLDFRALVGDPSDNIPGVKGIGEKGAAKLIEEWGDLETLLAHAAEVKAKRAREALTSQAETALLSRRLATLKRDVPLPTRLADLRLREPDTERLRELFERLGFTRLLANLDPGGMEPAREETGVATAVVADDRTLAELAKRVGEAERVVLVPLADESRDGALVGLAVAMESDAANYIPLGHADLTVVSLSWDRVREALGPVLSGPGAPRWGARDAKVVLRVFVQAGLPLPDPSFDIELAAFLLDPASNRTTAGLALPHLGRRLGSWEDLAGRGAKAVPASDLAVKDVAPFLGDEAGALHALEPLLIERIEQDGLAPLYRDVELPLVPVLARVEKAGVRVDEAVLSELSVQYQESLARIEERIYQLAGERFQIASPKQLQTILFEKLKLPPIKKTKTGYSTAEGVLEQLAARHDLPLEILAYRHLAKLKNTYVDAIPPLVDPRTGRVHPSFHQTGAATGRLSCTKPNLQNIPIRTEQGIRIREAFVPAEGCVLISADYSQVELRILAHFSGDESLIEAFRRGEDIHRRTAAEVAGVSPEEVTDDDRARAKAVNFGIIYGLSAFGLAQQLHIASEDAKQTIDSYFERYRGVRTFLDRTVVEAKERGFVRTLLDRRRYLPDLSSRNRMLRSAAERMAVNTVIQGTAADLIKKAMVAVDTALSAGSFQAVMILQVHDELILDVPKGEIEAVSKLLRECMEGVHPLEVPLKVDVGRGGNWREAH